MQVEIVDIGAKGDAPIATHIPYDPAKAREWTRIGVAGALIFLLFVVIVGGLYFIKDMDKDHYDRVKPLFEVMFTAVSTLVGTVVGFYFGSQSR